MNDYLSFLAAKRVMVAPSGFEVSARDINQALYPFQADCVRWALRLGKAALF